ncbi:hypothetical protein RB195_001870 [Necator americanus]|uniref:Uncharacterized protein n=1 Tax=Necator americanus TaxID=51031 RepID=A0ABR1DGN2_NECAM
MMGKNIWYRLRKRKVVYDDHVLEESLSQCSGTSRRTQSLTTRCGSEDYEPLLNVPRIPCATYFDQISKTIEERIAGKGKDFVGLIRMHCTPSD